jgi:hypothetical protein
MIAEREGVTRQTVTAELGPRPRSAPTKRTQKNIKVDPRLFAQAAKVAKSMGLTIGSSKQVGTGSVGQLIELIGAGHVTVALATVEGSHDRGTQHDTPHSDERNRASVHVGSDEL